MMTRQPAPPAEAALVPPPPPSTENCPPEVASTFYFDWDSTIPPADAAQSVAFMAENRTRCGWANFTVVGHTDRSGDRKSTRELQSLMRISYAVFCLKKKNKKHT